MSAPLLRLIGILLLVAAVVAAILNLHRVADLGMPWAGPSLARVGSSFRRPCEKTPKLSCHRSSADVFKMTS